ncbi:hypothetical protein GCM10011507_04270 [Edaphobacter acidisoli]|uniref:Flagella basal body P-ring formation protein FlgA SAF domain-containing protein n=1 Tax=Edaphobacter acidisoli TaxID=2040573 RepID=A0A916RHB4_9BACT|nr:flagella basal body P-ring formation protein FlgA [Edaphobacter acidisoli]GGA56123.1 hypothetical protein GCM10011507_04270 [Edaphobacter acidisoli]
MRKMTWPWWTMLFWFAAWVLAVLIATVAQAQCLPTPAAAAASVDLASFPTRAKNGYRVASINQDHALHKRWVMIVSCDHPDWPAIEMPLQTIQKQRSDPRELALLLLQTGPSIIRAGDAVELWNEQGNLRLEVAAISEQNGKLGEVVRVRLMQRQTLGAQNEKEFRGVVLGPRDVEMQP